MQQDFLLQKFFEYDRWQSAIEHGVFKDIRRKDLIELTSVKERERLLAAICSDSYDIAPPHTAKIPKNEIDPITKQMKYRIVQCNEPKDRVVLSIINDLLMELFSDMIHPTCRSYQKGIGCGMVVQEVSRLVTDSDGSVIGWKSDLSKYFDSVPTRFIDKAFDAVEARYGHSRIIDILRRYYHSGWYFDSETNQYVNAFDLNHTCGASLKQGCAVAAWLADVIIYHIDEKLSNLGGFYRRYSDDMIYIGPNHEQAMKILREELAAMEMELNDKKVDDIDRNHWFKFLGFQIKGSLISLSESRIKSFQYEIEHRTILDRDVKFSDAVRAVNRYLYRGDGEHAWATQVLPIINVHEDIYQLNQFVMDCLRAVRTGRKRQCYIGGLGCDKRGISSFIVRGRGRYVTSNRKKVPIVDGYKTIGCMHRALGICRALYDSIVANLSA